MVTVKIVQRPDAALFTPYKELFLSFLSEWERLSIERTRREKDKIEKTLGWLLCRMEIAQRYRVNPADIVIDFKEKGKPFFKDYPDVEFNITHGGEVIAVAFSDGKAVGIDVEASGRKVNLEIAERRFTSSETDFLKNTPENERPHAFLRLWTVKEAYLKMTGSGLTRALDGFEIKFTPEAILLYDHRVLQKCTIVQNESDHKHILTVCVEGVENYFSFARTEMETIINFAEKLKE